MLDFNDFSFNVMAHLRILICLLWAGLIQDIGEACTPTSLKNSLLTCMSTYGLSSYYQIPLIGQANYDKMCNNTLCLTNCMDTEIQACSSTRFVGHLVNGGSYKAAYLGFCAGSTATIRSTLLCAESVDNGAVLDAITLFERTLDTRATDYTVTTALTCTDYQTLTSTILQAVQAVCTSSTESTYWTTFLNTMYSGCDTSVTPSWYSLYHATVVPCTSSAYLPCQQPSIIAITTPLFIVALMLT